MVPFASLLYDVWMYMSQMKTMPDCSPALAMVIGYLNSKPAITVMIAAAKEKSETWRWHTGMPYDAMLRRYRVMSIQCWHSPSNLP
jgi:hypothetical protein